MCNCANLTLSPPLALSPLSLLNFPIENAGRLAYDTRMTTFRGEWVRRGLVLPAICLMFAGGMIENARADSAKKIDKGVAETLKRFYDEVRDGKKIVQTAGGVLVFPSVFKAGIGIGGEYGEGALLVKGKTADYYSTSAASIGFQLGAQKKSIIILFMRAEALHRFRESSGWKAGVDASIAVVKVGAGGDIDTARLNEPILAFVFGQKGLMYNLTLEGAKFTKLKK